MAYKKFTRLDNPRDGICCICSEYKLLEYNAFRLKGMSFTQILLGQPMMPEGQACRDCAVREMI